MPEKYQLVAEMRSPAWSGEIGRKPFSTIEDAEKEMARWARFGVDCYCNEADSLRILDGGGVEIRRWNWRRKRADAAGGPSGSA